jgi:hypothetical protein
MTADVNLFSQQLLHLEIPVSLPTTSAANWEGILPKECACGGYYLEVEDQREGQIRTGSIPIQTLNNPQGFLEEGVRNCSWDATNSLGAHHLFLKRCYPSWQMMGRKVKPANHRTVH